MTLCRNYSLPLAFVAIWTLCDPLARGSEDMAGQPVDVASSAYQYRADRKADDNPPESWLALMHYAKLPLNQPLDVDQPAIKRALCGLLWEEIRPIQKLELVWPAYAKRRPAPEDIVITTLNNRGTASSWWNNLVATQQNMKPAVSSDSLKYTYELSAPSCGIVISVAGGASAGDFDVPQMRAIVPEIWKKMDVEIEWAFDDATLATEYSGTVEAYDGIVSDLRPLEGDGQTKLVDAKSWHSAEKSPGRRGLRFTLLYMGTSHWWKVQPFISQRADVARSIVTFWTKSGNFSFLAADLEKGPILAPEYGFFVRRTSDLQLSDSEKKPLAKLMPEARPSIPAEPPIELASQASSAKQFIAELQSRKLHTIREQTRAHAEQTWEGAVTGLLGPDQPPHPKPPKEFLPAMQVEVPSERLTDQWNLGAWHLTRHAEKNPQNGRLWFNDYPYGILGAETYMILSVLDLMGSHQAAADGFDQWVSLPIDPNSKDHLKVVDRPAFRQLGDRPSGLFSDGRGCLTHAIGPPGAGGQMDGVHAFGPGSIGWALTEHYWMSGDREWLKAAAPRIKANAEWMLRQRRLLSSVMPGGDRLWCKGLQPALQVTPDSNGLWMNFYECEAYYWASIVRLAKTLSVVDPEAGAKLLAEAEAYRQDLTAAVERSIALSPVVATRDGTYHSVIPFACYVRGLGTEAWGWMRDGSGSHVGPLYWETVQSAAALISPAQLLPTGNVRVQGYLDVLEDRLLLENENVAKRTKGNWFLAGWQFQPGLERTANMHLAGDDIPSFLRSFLNGYAVDILPKDGYIFNEHAVHGPPDKIFEEAAFLERFRNLLVMEDEEYLWLNRAAPRAWLEQGQTISVKNAPTHFGNVDYRVVSDVNHGQIAATVTLPSRNAAKQVWLRLRHPKAMPIHSVTVNGKSWKDFDPAEDVVKLHGFEGTVDLSVHYKQ